MLPITTFCLIRMSHTRNPLCAAILSGCLTPGIPLHRHSIRVSHTQNSSVLSFHPSVSHPEFYPGQPSIFSRCLTPEIPLRRHSTLISHIRNPIRRRSTSSGCFTPGILSSRRSTFSGCLTSGILSRSHSTFSGCLTF